MLIQTDPKMNKKKSNIFQLYLNGKILANHACADRKSNPFQGAEFCQ